MLSRGLYVVGAKRTAIGAFGGKLKHLTPTDLQEHSARAALQAGNIDPNNIDSVIIGNCIHSSSDAIYIARHAGLRVGVPVSVPANAINRLCGTGFQVIVNAVHEIICDGKKMILTGGAESMSLAPHAVRNLRFGVRFGFDPKLEDTLWAGLFDTHAKMPMGITAENLAEKYNITRTECDEFALRSQKRWKAAFDAGTFEEEIVPIPIKGRKGMEEFKVDEHPKPQSTMESLSKLPTVFKKNGTIHAGNASGVCDGAAAVIVASEEAVKEHNLKPLARIVGYSYVGCPPEIMGIGPFPAIEQLLKTTGKKKEDIDLFEVNEAFAPQFLACEKALGLDPAKTNVNGGAIAIGHPLAASGSRITVGLVNEMRRRNAKFGVASACIGGGQGIAMMYENCQ